MVLIAPFDLARKIEVGPPVLEGPRLTVASSTKSTKSSKRARTRGAASGEPEPVPVPVATAPVAEDEYAGSRQGDPGRRLKVKEIRR
jgi:hypothetical protein